MDINEINKKLYEDAFISNGEYGDLNSWKPDIDERMIEESCEDENGKWVPATPLGYRDYKESRSEGIKSILSQEPVLSMTLDEAHNIKREDNRFKQYDKIEIEGNGYVVTADDEGSYYIVDEENHQYYIDYLR